MPNRKSGVASIMEDLHDTMHDPAMDEAYHKQVKSMSDKHPTEIRCPEQCLMFQQIMDQMYKTHLAKNQDYSPYNINATGRVGLVTRLWDKMARLMSLEGFDIKTGEYTGPKDAVNESVEDTLLDLANYAIIARIHRAGKWGK